MNRLMKTAFTLALALAIAAPCAFAEAATLSAQGTASIAAEPDVVTLTCSVEARDADLSAAQEKAAGCVSAATEALLSLGVAKEEITTAWYNVYPYYEEDENGKTRQMGYEVSHSLSVVCRDIALLDEVISAAGTAGMTSVSGITFDVSNRHALYLSALQLAVSAAREKAEMLASASGLAVAGVTEIRENANGDSVLYANAAEEDAGMSFARTAGAGISSGSVNVTASVTAVFSAE